MSHSRRRRPYIRPEVPRSIRAGGNIPDCSASRGTKPDGREASHTRILSTFNRTSYPKVSELCLARFDEVKSIGLDAFTKNHDPYWDIPLNENLPQPVIDLPGLARFGEDRFRLDDTNTKPLREGRSKK